MYPKSVQGTDHKGDQKNREKNGYTKLDVFNRVKKYKEPQEMSNTTIKKKNSRRNQL